MKKHLLIILSLSMLSVQMFAQTVWDLNSTSSIGGVTPTVEGNPTVITTTSGDAMEFDGVGDRIEVSSNPLNGLDEFTIEATFRIDEGGISEQKIIHMQAGSDTRILFEIEFVENDAWFLENYIQTGDLETEKVWLADTHKVHPANGWYHAAVTYKDGVFTQYINGIEENSGKLTWSAPSDGVFSLGARQSKTGYMTGAIKQLIFSSSALTPDQFTIDGELIASQTLWIIDNTTKIGGYTVDVFGDPTVIQTELGDALEFDGNGDGIFVNGNPLYGASEFTIETILKPYNAYPSNVEPRYLHFQDPSDNNRRITMEYRLNESDEWYFDGFIKSTTNNLALIDDKLVHATDEWIHAAITYKGGTFKTFVNGKEELSGSVTYEELPSTAIASLGMRMNEVNYMNGAIRQVRITQRALDPKFFRLVKVEGSTPPDTNSSVNLIEVASESNLIALIYLDKSDNLNVKINKYESSNAKVCVFNVQGQLIHSTGKLIENNGECSNVLISTSKWIKGLYIVNIATQKNNDSQLIQIL